MGEASLRTHCPHSAGSRSSKLVEITLNTRPLVSSTLFISHGKLGERLGSVAAVAAVAVVVVAAAAAAAVCCCFVLFLFFCFL